MRPLRPHQTSAIETLRQSLMAGKRRPLIQAPTGAGKTLLSAAIVDGALTKGKRVIFVVPALSLVDQTVNAFWAEGIRDIGVMQGRHEMTDPSRPVQVASIQTLSKRRIPEADIVIVDEAHRWFEFLGEWMRREGWDRKPFVGLSATPWTKGLGQHYDDLIVAATTQQLIDQGYLAPFRVFAPSHPDLEGVRTVAGDYHEGDLAKAMNRPDLVADVVATWLERGEGRPTLCFAVDRPHAAMLQRQFEAAGVKAGYVDAYTDPDERESIRKAFHRGDLQVVCNVGVLTTGVDWDVRCIVLARPTKSEMLFVQIVGRGLRTAQGKIDCLILDHSDSTLQLGFVTDIHHEALDTGSSRGGRERERFVAQPKECPSCKYVKPAKVHLCPVCGFAPERPANINCEDGELLELTADRKAKLPTPAEKATWYAMLLGYAEVNGKSQSWVLANYREKFKEWPRRKEGVKSIMPDAAVERWIRSRRIAWAKKREKEAQNANAA